MTQKPKSTLKLKWRTLSALASLKDIMLMRACWMTRTQIELIASRAVSIRFMSRESIEPVESGRKLNSSFTTFNHFDNILVNGIQLFELDGSRLKKRWNSPRLTLRCNLINFKFLESTVIESNGEGIQCLRREKKSARHLCSCSVECMHKRSI